MKNTLSKRLYTCKCKSIVEGYAWENELTTIEFKCNKCGNMVGFEQIKKKVIVQMPSIRTPTKNR
jgi:transcription initiation factor IIE alpha subunit